MTHKRNGEEKGHYPLLSSFLPKAMGSSRLLSGCNMGASPA